MLKNWISLTLGTRPFGFILGKVIRGVRVDLIVEYVVIV